MHTNSAISIASANGTERTSGDVRYLVGNGGKADMAGEARFGRE